MASRNIVNLDAMIPRADFTEDPDPAAPPDIRALDIHLLKEGFFAASLRKPDFQRETAAWQPEKVRDLIRAFLDAELMPSVILWQAGRNVFVLDGAHRISAVLAWINNDYGDELKSRTFFDGFIPDDQRNAAKRTRDLVKSTIGTFADYVVSGKTGTSDPVMSRRLANLTTKGIPCHWAAAIDYKTAENAFFKINQAATPIDPVEERILHSRYSAHAIAARAIMRGGHGTRYWKGFGEKAANEIEGLAANVYDTLFEPPLGNLPVKSLDLPIAGRGYNALPFVFDFVNISNGGEIPDSTQKKAQREKLPDDPDGSQSLKFLRAARDRLQLLTGNDPQSLGPHPAIYSYSRSGAFQPTLFLAMSEFFAQAHAAKELKKFQGVRAVFEEFLFERKELVSEVGHKYGSGTRSINWIVTYYRRLVDFFASGLDEDAALRALTESDEFSFLAPLARRILPDQTGGKPLHRKTKTAAFLTAAVAGGVRCALCGALVHKNSMSFDHTERKRDGGAATVENTGVSHFWCNNDKG